jgi:hypothetical protein
MMHLHRVKFVENQMDPEAWYDLIDKVLDKVSLL